MTSIINCEISEKVRLEKSPVIDIIVILDKSGSMTKMGKEPIESVNSIIEEQKKNIENDGSKFTLVMFNHENNRVFSNISIFDMEPIPSDYYKPDSFTALNDAVCSTIEQELASDKPNDKVVIIITDGLENCSREFSTTDTKNKITYCQEKHNWKFVFLGANIDAFQEGNNINIDKQLCSQFSQEIKGDLLQMCRQTSCNIADYRRASSHGYEPPVLTAAPSISDSFNEYIHYQI